MKPFELIEFPDEFPKERLPTVELSRLIRPRGSKGMKA